MRLAALALATLAACLPESVQSVTLSPATSDLAAVLHAADARWEAAGVAPDRLIVAPVGSAEGAPVRYTPERAPVSVTRVIGQGSAWAGVRWIELADLTLDTATHELGHALGINLSVLDAEHVADCGDDQPARAVMCAHVGGAITDADLAMACEAGACVGYSPER
jgi:hypothetical protein